MKSDLLQDVHEILDSNTREACKSRLESLTNCLSQFAQEPINEILEKEYSKLYGRIGKHVFNELIATSSLIIIENLV